MQLRIRTRGVDLDATTRDQVARNLTFALARVGAVVPAVEVTLLDVNGPRGGVDKRCRLRVAAPGRRAIVVEQAHRHVLGAVAGAADRLARLVVRALERARPHAGAV